MTPAPTPPLQESGPEDDSRPPLMRDRSFWGMTSTQFLGAFNDNLFKQVIMLLFVAVPGRGDMQWLATLVFSLPFILFSGFAGFLSDRFSKKRVIVASKVAELVVMSAGAAAFLAYAPHFGPWIKQASAVEHQAADQRPQEVEIGAATGLAPEQQQLYLWIVGLLAALLFCMGAQSAYFGPGKYGILPELFRNRDLPSANGIILMTTFLAIIFGMALAGPLMDGFPSRLWVVGICCSLIAVAGIGTSLLVRPSPAVRPDLPLRPDALFIPGDMMHLLRKDLPLRMAVIVSSVFWMGAALVQMSVNALGDRQLHLPKTKTSVMAAMISIGIATGAIMAGRMSQKKFHVGVMKAGAWGMVGCLALLSLPDPFGPRPHLLGFWGSIPVLILLGQFTGMFAVPLQVFMQTRPPDSVKGRMIATQNLLNWIGITFSSALYFAANKLTIAADWPTSAIFALPAAILLAVALMYHPESVDL